LNLIIDNRDWTLISGVKMKAPCSGVRSFIFGDNDYFCFFFSGEDIFYLLSFCCWIWKYVHNFNSDRILLLEVSFIILRKFGKELSL